MHGKMKASGAELAAKKAASNRGRGRGGGPGHPPKKVGLANSRFLRKLAGREVVGEEDGIMGDMEYSKKKLEAAKARKGLTFILRAQNQIRHFGQFLFIPTTLLLGLVLFLLRSKDLELIK